MGNSSIMLCNHLKKGLCKYHVILKYKNWKVHGTHGTLRVPLNTHKDPVLMCLWYVRKSLSKFGVVPIWMQKCRNGLSISTFLHPKKVHPQILSFPIPFSFGSFWKSISTFLHFYISTFIWGQGLKPNDIFFKNL